MQKQMQESFQAMVTKMNDIESRLKADELKQDQLNNMEQKQEKIQNDIENRKMFQRLQESISSQKQTMLDFVDRATTTINKSVELKEK